MIESSVALHIENHFKIYEKNGKKSDQTNWSSDVFFVTLQLIIKQL